jgi:hypothetical protein
MIRGDMKIGTPWIKPMQPKCSGVSRKRLADLTANVTSKMIQFCAAGFVRRRLRSRHHPSAALLMIEATTSGFDT